MGGGTLHVSSLCLSVAQPWSPRLASVQTWRCWLTGIIFTINCFQNILRKFSDWPHASNAHLWKPMLRNSSIRKLHLNSVLKGQDPVTGSPLQGTWLEGNKVYWADFQMCSPTPALQGHKLCGGGCGDVKMSQVTSPRSDEWQNYNRRVIMLQNRL